MSPTKALIFPITALILAVFPLLVSAQNVQFSEDFSSIPSGQEPPPSRWVVLGALDSQFWRTDGEGLNTGDLDAYFPGLSWAVLNTAESDSWRNIRLNASFRMLQPEGSIAAAVRVQDNSNYYYGIITSAPGGLLQAELYRMMNGIPIPISQVDSNSITFPSFANGASHQLAVEAEGSRISLILNDTQLLSTTDQTFRDGSIAIGAAFNQVVFESVTVTGSGQSAASAPRVAERPQTGSGGSWRILVRDGLSESEANEQASRLGQETTILPKDGQFAIYIGAYPTQQGAEAEFERLKNEEGIILAGVENTSGATGSVPSGRPSVAAVSEEGAIYRVAMGNFETLEEAEERRDYLQKEVGIWDAEIYSDGPGHSVLVGFIHENRASAEEQANVFRNEGYSEASVIAINSTGAQALAGAIKGAEDSGGFMDILAEIQERKNQGQTNIADDYSQRNLPPEMVALIRQAEDISAEGLRMERVKFNLQLVRRALIDGEYDLARERLDEVRTLDANNPVIDILSEEIEQAERGTISSVPTAVPPQQQAQTIQQRNELLLSNARSAEQAGRLQDALDSYRQLKNNSPSQEMLGEANQAILRLEEQLSAVDVAQQSGEGGGGGNLVLYAGIGGAAVVVIGAGIFLIAGRKKKPAPVPAKPMMTPAAAAVPKPADKKSEQKAPQPAAAKSAQRKDDSEERPTPASTPKPEQHPSVTVSDSERIRPGIQAPAPSDVPAELAAETEKPFSLEDSSESVRLDDDSAPPIEEAAAPPIEDAPPLEAAQRPSPSSETVKLTPDQVPPTHPSPPSGVHAADPNLYFEQGFEEESPGEKPNKWKGDYDYASLTVAAEGANGSKQCLKFEKKKGTGSAYYACRFPDAGGRVSVEFDLRCDDKNKYLLGFYIEKDEDFRHSIHTVVHKDMSKQNKVTLRLQNESVPYELGTWVHIRYSIDLHRNLVDGYVNEEPVAMGLRLASRPRIVNTLSIRDNLATEGVLLIDNIKIKKEV